MNKTIQIDNRSEGKREKVVFIELLRIIACFLVIVNHTNSRIFLSETPSILWFLSIAYFFVSKIAVPIFIMISGYVMLNHQDTYQKIFKQFLRIATCLLFFSMLYYVSYYLSGTIENLDMIEFVKWIISKPITNAFWYLYLYLGIILMLPFIQKMVVNMEKEDFHMYFLISGLFFSIWPIIVHYKSELSLSGHFVLPLFNSYICMLLAGCYIRRYFVPNKRNRNICLVIFCMICILNVLLSYNEYVRNDGKNYLFFDNREFFPIVVASFCVFYIVSTVEISEKVKKKIISVGKLTFGIYLISDFLINKMLYIYMEMISEGIYPMVAMLFFEFIIFFTGLVITWGLKKIPFIKWLI